MLEKYILNHYNKYPKMQEEDLIKLIYQAAFGPNHFVYVNKDTITSIIEKERKNIEIKQTLNIEEISDEYVRVYLDSNISSDKIVEMFINSMASSQKNISLFEQGISSAISLIENNEIYLSKNKVLRVVSELKTNNFLPISHSVEYKNNYNPHYRVIKKEMLKS